jgi:hypothetical protein
MQNDTITSLSALAAATADYESAWRASVAAKPSLVFDHSTRRHVSTPEAVEANHRMASAAAVQRAHREALIEQGYEREFVYALEAALVIASARPEGERPAEYRQNDEDAGGVHAGPVQCIQFMREVITQGGIV